MVESIRKEELLQKVQVKDCQFLLSSKKTRLSVVQTIHKPQILNTVQENFYREIDQTLQKRKR